MSATETKDEQNVKRDAKKKHVDWKSYGLESDAEGAEVEQQRDSDLEDNIFHSNVSSHNELYAEHQGSNAKPWWKVNFFVLEPVLFGTWDGVFTSCMINLFGIIVFLRSGWMVGEAGILHSCLVIAAVGIIILTSVFAGIGICERCPVERGGVYFLLSHVLGGRVGGSIGILYCFGQAVGAAICSIGFGESIGHLLNNDDIWVARGIGIALLFVLVLINIAGVLYVIKLQFILLLLLLLGALDFVVGSFISVDEASGVYGYLSDNFLKNSKPAYTEGNNWFTVFGVFFPTMTGVFAGINMSGDLRNPNKDIPAGTLSAVGVCSCIYFAFVLILGATCQRSRLLTDYLIAEKVSAVGVMFLAALYISSMSACLATLYGTPRVLQSIALENVIPFIKFLGRGRGPNKVPVYGILVIAVVTLIFILSGQINTLAPVVTMPFMLTYASINYAYFCLAMSYDKRLPRSHATNGLTTGEPVSTYGTTQGNIADSNTLRPQPPIGSQSSSLVSSPDEHSSIHSGDSYRPGSVDSVNDFSQLIPKGGQKQPRIGAKSGNWYSVFCNRWISLLGILVNLVIMFCVHWIYALSNILVAIVLYVYIGRANPGASPGVAEFKLLPWIKSGFVRVFGKQQRRGEVVVTPLHPGIEVMASQVTEDNEDYAGRERYHKSSTMVTDKFNQLSPE